MNYKNCSVGHLVVGPGGLSVSWSRKKKPNNTKHVANETTSPVDPLARGSMKNAANCVSKCELQDT